MLQSGRAKDLLFLNCLGNSMMAKDAHYADRNGFHNVHPNLLNDQEFYNLAYDFNTVLSTINSLFKGRVVVMGPMPRHLSDCCGQPSHWIRDEEDKRVDMVKYTGALAEHIHRASEMYPRFTYVKYQSYLGKPFIPAMIDDNVHWSETTRKELANYVVMWLENKSAGDPKPSEHATIEPFSTALAGVEITVRPVNIEKAPIQDSDTEESEDEEEEGEEGDGEDNEDNQDMDQANPVFPPEAPGAANQLNGADAANNMHVQ